MKIAIISSAAIPAFPDPNLYSGLEVVISNLAAELAKRKHEVHVLSSMGSTMAGVWEYEDEETKAKLGTLEVRETVQASWDGLAEFNHFLAYKDWVMENFGDGQGIVLDSTWSMYGYYLVGGFNGHMHGGILEVKPNPKLKMMHIHHGMPNSSSRPPRVKWPRVMGLSKTHALWLSSIMRTPVRYMWNGIPLPDVKPEDCQPTEEPYLLSLNRMTDEKGIHDSINCAVENGMRIIVAGDDISVRDQNYVSQIVEQCRNSGGLAKYVGSIDNHTKQELLKHCSAVISCPITQGPRAWIEGFGLNVVEGLSYYKPFIGTANGGHMDIIENGKQGFLAGTPAEVSSFVSRIDEIDGNECRKRVEAEFTVERMADRYEDIFHKVMTDDLSARW